MDSSYSHSWWNIKIICWNKLHHHYLDIIPRKQSTLTNPLAEGSNTLNASMREFLVRDSSWCLLIRRRNSLNSMLLCILSRLTVLTYLRSSESGVNSTNYQVSINTFRTRNSDAESVHYKAKFSKAQNSILIFVKEHKGFLQVWDLTFRQTQLYLGMKLKLPLGVCINIKILTGFRFTISSILSGFPAFPFTFLILFTPFLT